MIDWPPTTPATNAILPGLLGVVPLAYPGLGEPLFELAGVQRCHEVESAVEGVDGVVQRERK
jgi:hypothetical protein